MRTMMNNWIKFSIAFVAAISLASSSFAQDQTDQPTNEESPRQKLVTQKRLNTIAKTQSPVEGFSSVDLFQAMDHGEIEVIIRNKDAANANLIVENKTDKPLAIRMPAAFSCVPVMRQGGAGAPGMVAAWAVEDSAAAAWAAADSAAAWAAETKVLAVDSVAAWAAVDSAAAAWAAAAWAAVEWAAVEDSSISRPDALVKHLLKTFCLEEGKPDPRSRIEYRIQPLTDLNSDPKIFEMCRMLANDEIAQPVAQAAAWNVANGLSWHELLVKNRIERMDGSFERYFHPQHLVIAQRVTVASAQRAEARAKWLKEQQKYESEARYQTSSEASNE